jgi:HlyD family type I secretion membrane fusion protein
MTYTKRLASATGSGPSRTAPPSLATEIRKPARLGLLLILLFFGVGGVWAAKAPLSSAVIASGLVSPQASRQTVQHLEGGIIRDIRVSEGDHVKKGDVLVVLQDVSAQAEVGSALARLRVLAAREARLDAERHGSTTIAFRHRTLADASDPDVRAIHEQQRDQLRARLANNASRKSILTQRIVQLEKQINGYERQFASAKKQDALIGEEIEAVTELFRKGLERKPRLLALKRTRAQLLGTQGELQALMARAKEAIGETRLRIINLDAKRQEEIAAELSDVEGQRAELEQKIKSSKDRLERTEIVAPIAGTVLGLRFKTQGGVIKPGDPILDLVPQEDELVIEARVRTTDIDEVQMGQPAYVMFPGLPQRNLLRIEGRVTRVAADALVDDATGDRYYDARVVIDRKYLSATLPDIALTPRMLADVFIGTGERTMLDYILQPFLQTLERTFRET